MLIVAMLLCSIIGVSLASYMNLSRTSMEVSNRALYNNGAMNLAENGLEQAVFSINKSVSDPSYAWSGWSISGSNARQEWTGYDFRQGATGTVRAYIYNYAGGASPKVVTRSTVSLGTSGTRSIEKWIEVHLRKTSKFANGLVAKETISFSGNNASVDSWNSDPDDDPSTAAIPYSAAVKNDNGSVGSISVSVNAILINNADIWGYASTGGSLPSVGANGIVGPFGTPSGTMDLAHVSTDFTASFDPVAAPTVAPIVIAAITDNTILPRVGDTPAADGKYYYSCQTINFNNKTFRASADVVLTLTDPMTSIAIAGGSSGIVIDTGASLEIYAAGDISIAGNGIMNGGTTAATANQPINCQIYGTKPSGVQSIAIRGNGVLSAVVYAPQGSVSINGNGDVCGSVVANNISCTGNAFFHYDESLANFGARNPYRVSKWKELTTAAERSAYTSVLSW